jgi:hypothetical protein
MTTISILDPIIQSYWTPIIILVFALIVFIFAAWLNKKKTTFSVILISIECLIFSVLSFMLAFISFYPLHFYDKAENLQISLFIFMIIASISLAVTSLIVILSMKTDYEDILKNLQIYSNLKNIWGFLISLSTAIICIFALLFSVFSLVIVFFVIFIIFHIIFLLPINIIEIEISVFIYYITGMATVIYAFIAIYSINQTRSTINMQKTDFEIKSIDYKIQAYTKKIENLNENLMFYKSLEEHYSAIQKECNDLKLPVNHRDIENILLLITLAEGLENQTFLYSDNKIKQYKVIRLKTCNNLKNYLTDKAYYKKKFNSNLLKRISNLPMHLKKTKSAIDNEIEKYRSEITSLEDSKISKII